MDKKKVTVDEIRQLLISAPEFNPFREIMTEMKFRVAKRKMGRMKDVNTSED